MKSPLLALLVLGLALPAAAQGSNNPHSGASSSSTDATTETTETTTPPPEGWLGAGQPVPGDLKSFSNEAKGYCPAMNTRTEAAGAYGDFTCDCAAGAITQQAWSDYDYAYSGPFMTSADAKLIADTLRTAQTMSEAGGPIYYGLSPAGQSVLSSCYSK
jgi:hypothetical protein